MNAPWNRKRAADPITRARTTAPSSNRQPQPQSRPRVQQVCNRQRLQERLNGHQWACHLVEESSGPQHALMWKVTFFSGHTGLGTSSWFTSKDAAKEDAAKNALEWLDAYEAAQAQARTNRSWAL